MAWFVNGELVDDAAVRDEAAMMRPQYMQSVAGMDPIEAEMQLRDWARENVIERMLLRAEALRDPEPVPAEAAENEVEYRLQRLLHRIQSQVKLPKAKAIADYYKQHKENFIYPEMVRAAHVVKNVDEQNHEATARAGIEAAMAELEAGAPFAEVADRHSDCPGDGGLLDWFPPGAMVDEFESVVAALQIGERSGIFRTPFGFHIAMLLDRRPAGPRPFKEIEGELTNALMQQMRTKAVEDYIDGLRAKAEIRQGKAPA
ncbi:MAG TPA: peptidylprolyl isomerase [Bryobacteraceae bacterium]|nr:peptidylprolyl isomerase [Bryobacteraceae bacterium]